MKRTYVEITESYVYDSYEEFEKHYEEMISLGFRPHSDSSKLEYYDRIRDLNQYIATYYKRMSNHS